jgi:hypothetical protein
MERLGYMQSVTHSIEESLWDGIRTIEASQMLMLHTAKHLRELNEHEAADLLLQKAEDAKRRANLVRQALMSNEILSQDNINEDVKLNEADAIERTKGGSFCPDLILLNQVGRSIQEYAAMGQRICKVQALRITRRSLLWQSAMERTWKGRTFKWMKLST